MGKKTAAIQTSRRPCEYQHKILFKKFFVFYKFGAFFKKVSFATDETIQALQTSSINEHSSYFRGKWNSLLFAFKW